MMPFVLRIELSTFIASMSPSGQDSVTPYLPDKPTCSTVEQFIIKSKYSGENDNFKILP